MANKQLASKDKQLWLVKCKQYNGWRFPPYLVLARQTSSVTDLVLDSHSSSLENETAADWDNIVQRKVLRDAEITYKKSAE